MYRPRVDYTSENSQLDDEELEPDELDDKFAKKTNETVKSDIMFQPAKEHPEWKWVVLWEGLKTFLGYKRQAKYCDPDNFQMHIYITICAVRNSWNSWKTWCVSNLLSLHFVLIGQDTCLRCYA
jgi:hypothetical protein